MGVSSTSQVLHRLAQLARHVKADGAEGPVVRIDESHWLVLSRIEDLMHSLFLVQAAAIIANQEKLDGQKALGLDINLDEVVLFGHVRNICITMEILQERRLRRPASMCSKMVWKSRAHSWRDVTAYIGTGYKSGGSMLYQHFEVHHIKRRTRAEEAILHDMPSVKRLHVHERRKANYVYYGLGLHAHAQGREEVFNIL